MTVVLDLVHGGERSRALAFHDFEQERVFKIRTILPNVPFTRQHGSAPSPYRRNVEHPAALVPLHSFLPSPTPALATPASNRDARSRRSAVPHSHYAGQMTPTAVPLTTLVDESTTSEAEGCRKWGFPKIVGLRDTFSIPWIIPVRSSLTPSTSSLAFDRTFFN